MSKVKKTLISLLLSLSMVSCQQITEQPINSEDTQEIEQQVDRERNTEYAYENNNISLEEEILESVLRSVGRLEISVDGNRVGNASTCTGTVLYEISGYHYVLTANHCVNPLRHGVPDDSLLNLKFNGVNGGEVVIRNQRTDSALLRFPSSEFLNVMSVPIGNSDSLAEGDYIYAVGYSLAIDKFLSDGIVRSTRYLKNGNTFDYNSFIFSASINPGNSGGPIFAIEQGQMYLVGLVSRYYVNGDNLYVASDINPVIIELRRGIDNSLPLQLNDPLEEIVKKK